ncbi:MAG: DNA translocase FtsK 4TM domain-containing protein [Methyloligellaceae bacterium]
MVVTRTAVDSDRLLPDRVEATLRRWCIQFSGIFILCAALAGWMCLATWSVGDPSPNNATSHEARNFLGSFGATLADMMFQSVGLASIFFFLPIAAWGWYCITYRFPTGFLLRVIAWPLSILCLAGAFSYYKKLAAWPLPHGLGGMMGDGLLRQAPTFLEMVYLPPSVKLSAILLLAFGVLFLFGAIAVKLRDFLSMFVVEQIGIKALILGIAGILINIAFEIKNIFIAIGYKYEKVKTARERRQFKRQSFPKLEMEDRSVFGHKPKEDVKEYAGPEEEEREKYPSFSTRHSNQNEDEEDERTFDLDEPLAAYADKDNRPDLVSSLLRRRKRKAKSRNAPAATHVKTQKVSQFILPNYRLLNKPDPRKKTGYLSKEALTENAHALEEVLADFGVVGTVNNVHAGPVVTLYEFEPARGTKSARVIGLANDIARSMSAISARVSVIPGRNAIGIELPNDSRETVYLRNIFEMPDFSETDAELPLVLGRTIGGEPVTVDLVGMPHLLIAGTTGSGKSVGINAMILSLLFKLSPDQCKFIMIDPKMLELSVYDGIPHLLTPVVTDPKKAVAALKWVVQEMEERYKKMSKINVRNIKGYNARVKQAKATGEKLSRVVQTGFDHETGEAIYQHEEMDFEDLPYIVVVIDEMADLMMVAGKEIEAAVQRLAQMARAAGIHLITATQRPSVDVITGTIKANFPTRISYQVSSKVDSRTILGEMGAEQLLGSGDMLYLPSAGKSLRVHGPYVTDEEIETVVEMLSAQGVPEYIEEVTAVKEDEEEKGTSSGKSGDMLYDKAVDLVLRDQKVSISYVQRRLSVGYNKAATFIERMEEEGLISPPNNSGKRQILVN